MPTFSSESITLQALRTIDAVCLDFESQFASGQKPSLTDYLGRGQFAAHERQYLFRELLRVQLELGGEPAKVVGRRLAQEFPEFASLIEEITATAAFSKASTPSQIDPSLSTTIDRVVGNSRGGSQPAFNSNELDRFRVVRSHAKGGLGEVLLAHDDSLGRSVALKRIRRDHAEDPGIQQRFLREAAITAGLQHPGIVPVYSVGNSSDGQPYYSMRFVEGRDFGVCIREFHTQRKSRTPLAQSLPFRQLLQRMISVCDTVHYAHDRGVIHRDLKPANIMVGDYGETLVVDWGLAKLTGLAESNAARETAAPALAARLDLTQFGAVVGTLAYMAPEQATGDAAKTSSAADIYSLGATLFHVLAGQPPFTGKDRDAVLVQVLKGEIPFEKLSAVPTPLQSVCRRACALQPVDRYANAAEIARELERWLANEPVLAHSESISERAARLSRRYRAWFQAGGLALVMLLMGAAFALVQVTRERNRAVKLAEEKGKLVIDKERLLGEKSTLLTRQTKLTDEKSSLATRNAQLAVGQLRAREQAESQALVAVYQQAALALEAGDTITARHLLVEGIAQVETARQNAADLAAQDSLLPLSPEHEKTLNHWDRAYRLQLAATHQTNPFLEAVVDGGAFQPDPIIYSADETSALIRRITVPKSTALQINLENGALEPITIAVKPLNQWTTYYLADDSRNRDPSIFFKLPLGKQLQVPENTAYLGRSSDSTHYVVSQPDKQVVVLDSQGVTVATAKLPTDQEYVCASFSELPFRLALGTKAGTIYVLDLKTEALRRSQADPSGILRVQLSADGNWVVSLSATGLGVWNLRDRTFKTVPVKNRIRGVFHSMGTVFGFLPGDKVVAISTTNPGTIRLFNVQTAEEMCEPLSALGEVTKLFYSPSGDHLGITQLPAGFRMHPSIIQPTLGVATESPPPLALLWNREALVPAVEEPLLVSTINVFASGRGEASFHPQAPVLAAIRDKKPWLIRLDSGPGTAKELACPVNITSLGGFTPDGQELFGFSEDKRLYFWNLQTQSVSRLFDCSPYRFDRGRNWFSPAGDKLVHAVSLTELTYWDLHSGTSQSLKLPLRETQGGAFVTSTTVACTFSPSGKYFLAGSRDGSIQAWDAKTGAPVIDEIPGGDITNIRIQLSPREDRLIACPTLAPPRLLEFPSGRDIATLSHTATVTAIAFDPTGDRFALATADGDVNCYSSETGERVAPTAKHSQGLFQVAFGEQGKVLITDGNGVHRWDLETGRKLGRTISGKLAAISPDGKQMAIRRPDGRLDVMPTSEPAPGTAAELRLILQAATATEWTQHQSVAPLVGRQLLQVHEQVRAAKGKLSLLPLPMQALPPEKPTP